MNPCVSLVDRTARVYARMNGFPFFQSTPRSTVRIGRVVRFVVQKCRRTRRGAPGCSFPTVANETTLFEIHRSRRRITTRVWSLGVPTRSVGRPDFTRFVFTDENSTSKNSKNPLWRTPFLSHHSSCMHRVRRMDDSNGFWF